MSWSIPKHQDNSRPTPATGTNTNLYQYRQRRRLQSYDGGDLAPTIIRFSALPASAMISHSDMLPLLTASAGCLDVQPAIIIMTPASRFFGVHPCAGTAFLRQQDGHLPHRPRHEPLLHAGMQTSAYPASFAQHRQTYSQPPATHTCCATYMRTLDDQLRVHMLPRWPIAKAYRGCSRDKATPTGAASLL